MTKQPTTTTTYNILAIFTIATLVLLGSVAGQCPTECTCEGTKTECSIVTKSQFPDLPANTQTLVIIGTSPNTGIIETLSKTDLEKYENLTELTLSELGINSLASDTFSTLTKLKRIDLSNNNLGHLPKGIFDNLSEMTYLDLKHNRLDTITSEELNFPLLSVLSLKGNSIKLNDSTVFKHLRGLHLLDVSDNYIGDPVPDYDGPADLRVVSLKNCSIKSLSTELRTLVGNAERVELQHNEITEIPVDFAPNLINLRELYLDHNQIQEIKNLTFEMFEAFTVTLNNNNISNIEPRAFESFGSTWLWLDHNQISDLPPRLFQDMGVDLKDLYLNDNPIKQLTDEVFHGLTGLTTLKLDSSQIEEISDFAFANTNADHLDLRNNNLTTLSNATIQTFAGFKNVSLHGSEWNCTEPLLGLRNWLLSNNQSRNCDQAGATNCLKCASPEKFAGRFVVGLSAMELITALDPETTTPEPTTTTPEPTTTTTTPEPTTPEPETPAPTTPEPPTTPKPEATTSGGTSTVKINEATLDFLLYIYIAVGVLAFLLFLVLICLCLKTCYKCREVTYPLAMKELENGYVPETGEKQDDSVQLEHIFTIEGHTNPGFKMADEDDDASVMGASMTSLSTFRPGREPCRDSGIVGDSPGSDQSINRPIQAWEGRTFGYENSTYNNLDEYT